MYLGGDQEVPGGVTYAAIDLSVKIVRSRAFAGRQHLISVIFHDGVEIVEAGAFSNCESLRRLKLLGVREIGDKAFDGCFSLTNVEFGDRLETVGVEAFGRCLFLRSIKMPSVRIVQRLAFGHCYKLTDVEFGIDLDTMEKSSFYNCPNLQRIAIPLKDNLFTPDPIEQQHTQFDGCGELTVVDLVGAEGIHETFSSFLMESWRDGMKAEIGRINQELPNTHMSEKTNAIRLWVRSVINRMDHYKAEHNRLLKEHMTQLELALWKAKLDEKEEDSTQCLQTMMMRVKINEESAREEKRITSGADIIIKNVLPFLELAMKWE